MWSRVSGALIVVACGGSQPPPAAKPGAVDRCRGAPAAIADHIGRTLEQSAQAAGSQEEAAVALLELTPEQERGRELMLAALKKQKLTRAEFGQCLERDAEAYKSFQGRLEHWVESARTRARMLPELAATDEGCLRLLPLTVSAKENYDLPIAVAARMVLPCAGRVSERELRCAIAEGNIAHFTACQRGERDPPASSH